MSKSNAFETALLNLAAGNANIANLGDATGVRGSTTAGSLYLSLHTADPGEAGDQSTNEITYTGYNRMAKARDGVALTVTGNTLALAANTNFPAGTGGSGTATKPTAIV